MKRILNISLLIIILSHQLIQIADAGENAYYYEKVWIEALSEPDTDKRADELISLLDIVNTEISNNQNDTELLIVRGNINLEIASALNSMSSLGYLKDGRNDLQIVIKSKPMVMDSMAEASLASAIFWAPGWPLSYGDKKESLQLFEQALKNNPDSFELLTQYAHAQNHLKNSETALTLYQQALDSINKANNTFRQPLMQARRKEIEISLKTLINQNTTK